jgi:hypothetical protein
MARDEVSEIASGSLDVRKHVPPGIGSPRHAGMKPKN